MGLTASYGPPLNVSRRRQLRGTGEESSYERGDRAEMNHTTPYILPTRHKPVFPGYYALIPCVLLILAGCVVAVVRLFTCIILHA